MTLGSCSHIWSTAPQSCEAGQHLPVPVKPHISCTSEKHILLKLCGNSFITTLKYSYISYNQTRDSSWYHSNACQKEDGTESSVQKDRRVWDCLPASGIVHLPWAVQMWITVLQVCTGPNLFWRFLPSQPHFFSMPISTKIRNFLILIFFPICTDSQTVSEVILVGGLKFQCCS